MKTNEPDDIILEEAAGGVTTTHVNVIPAYAQPVGMGRNEVIRAFQSIIATKSGVKTSARFVGDAEAIFDYGFAQGILNRDDMEVLMLSFKKASLSSSAETRKIFNDGMARRDSGKPDELIKQYQSSRLSAFKVSLFTKLLSLIDRLVAIAARTGVNDQCLKWGTIVQTTHFMDSMAPFKPDVLTKIVPNANFLLMSPVFYNICDFAEVHTMIAIRYNALKRFIKTIKDSKLATWVEPMSKLPGTNIISTSGQWVLNSQGVQKLRDDLKELGEGLVNGVTALDPQLSANLYVLMKYSTVVDCRVLIQTRDMKVLRTRDPNNKSFFANKQKIKVMVNLIRNVGLGLAAVETEVDLNSDRPDRGQPNPYIREYYNAWNILRATIRGMFYQIQPRLVGADRRNGTLKV